MNWHHYRLRTLRRVLLAIALGFPVSISLAWIVVILSPDVQDDRTAHYWSEHSPSLLLTRYELVYSFGKSQIIHSLHDYNEATRATLSGYQPLEPARLKEPLSTVFAFRQGVVSHRAHCFGLPFRCLMYANEENASGPRVSLTGGWVRGPSTIVPLTLMWTGLAANSLLLAMPLYGLIAWLHNRRYHILSEQGNCGECGASRATLGSLSPCTICGSVPRMERHAP